VTINYVLPLKAARRDATANLKCFGAPGHQRLNFDVCIYIHYAVPPYLSCISVVSQSLVGFRLPCATLGNEAERKIYLNIRSYFNPFVDQSSRNLQMIWETLRPFQRFCSIVCGAFHSEDIRY